MDLTGVRRAAAALARASRRFTHLATALPEVARPGEAAAIQATVAAIRLALYRYTAYRSRSRSVPDDSLAQVDLVGPGGERAAAAVRTGKRLAAAVTLARDLINQPGGELTPKAFADRAAQVASTSGLDCEIWKRRRITQERLGDLMGVSRGSTQPPRLVRLSYTPPRQRRSAGLIALVGIGITFDAGGLNLKPGMQMVQMKSDMGGAGAVLGAMSVLREVGCRVPVRAYLPLSDNMPGGDAFKPGERHGGAILGALFLAEFVPAGIPWAHIDMAGCVMSDRDDGELTVGATGYGVRTLVELLTGPEAGR